MKCVLWLTEFARLLEFIRLICVVCFVIWLFWTYFQNMILQNNLWEVTDNVKLKPWIKRNQVAAFWKSLWISRLVEASRRRKGAGPPHPLHVQTRSPQPFSTGMRSLEPPRYIPLIRDRLTMMTSSISSNTTSATTSSTRTPSWCCWTPPWPWRRLSMPWWSRVSEHVLYGVPPNSATWEWWLSRISWGFIHNFSQQNLIFSLQDPAEELSRTRCSHGSIWNSNIKWLEGYNSEQKVNWNMKYIQIDL